MGWCVKNKRRGAERLCKRLFILYLDDIKYDAPDDHRAKSCNILCHLKVARFNEAYPPLKPYYVDFIKKKPRRRSLFIINLPHIILPKKKEKKRKKEFSNSNPLLEKEKEIRSKMGVYLRAMRSVVETRASSLNPKKKKKRQLSSNSDICNAWSPTLGGNEIEIQASITPFPRRGETRRRNGTRESVWAFDISLSLSSFYPLSFEGEGREKEERLNGVKSGARSQYRDVLFSIDAQPREEYRAGVHAARRWLTVVSRLTVNHRAHRFSLLVTVSVARNRPVTITSERYHLSSRAYWFYKGSGQPCTARYRFYPTSSRDPGQGWRYSRLPKGPKVSR